MPELIPENADDYARRADWVGLKAAIDFNHFRETLKAAFASIGKAREAAAQHGVQQINGRFAQAGRKVRYRKYSPDQPRDEREDAGDVLKVLFDKDASDRYAFDLYSQEIQDELRAAQDQLIQQLEQEARDAIDQIVLNGAMQGLGPEDIMDDIRDQIGLTARQSQAVANYRQMLEDLDPGALQRQLRNFMEDDQVQAALDSGEDLDAALVDKLVQDYTDNYLDYRAETIADTESTRAVNAGLQDAYSQAIDRGVFPADAVRQYWRLGPNPCEVCQSIPDMNPDGVAIDESFDSIDGPMDAPPDPHPSCFPGYVIVSASTIEAVSKRRYNGSLIVICTALGKELSCTPNHPILTPGGFRPAHLLDVGSDVVCVRSGWQFIEQDHEHVPTSIKQVADAFGRSREVSSIPVPVSAPDFHGDGVGSEVAVVWSNRLLRSRGDAAMVQKFGQSGLSWRAWLADLHDGGSRLAAFLHRSLSSSCGLVGLCCARLALAFGYPARLQRQPLAVTADGNTVLLQEGSDRFAADTVLASKLIGRRASEVVLDHIVDVRTVVYDGHVYNLQTDVGWFTAEGIIVHNCQCDIEIVTNLDMVPDDGEGE